MKKINAIYFLIFLGWSVQAQTTELDRVIDFSIQNETIEVTLNQLMDETNISLSFSNQIVPNQRVTIDEKQKTFRFVLKKILKNTALTYELIGHQIVLIQQNIPPPTTQKYTISGSLEDYSTGEKLIGGNIFDVLSGKGTVTNEYGFFSFTLPKGQKEIIFSYLGYKPSIIKINLNKNQFYTISLKPVLTLSEVVVTAVDSNSYSRNINLLSDDVSIETISALPALMGEPDLQRSLQLTTGVQSGADGVGGLHVRGGSMDQNLYLIDGVPIYNPSHAFGVFSVFNTSIIRNARLIKGGFPARYGGRLSSILDVRTKEGNFKSFHGEAAIGLLSGRLTLEGPLAKNKTSFLVSGRSSFLNTYLKPFTNAVKKKRGEKGQTAYRYYDFNAKFNHKFSKTSQIYFSFYTGKDDFEDESAISIPSAFINPNTGDTLATGHSNYFSSRHINYGNTIGALRWNKMWSKNLFSNTTITFSDYQFNDALILNDSLVFENQTISKDLTVLKSHSSIQDMAAKIDFDYVPDQHHYVRFGANVVQHKFVPGAIAINDDSQIEGESELTEIELSNDSIQATEFNLYLEDEIKLGSDVSINFGTHLSSFNVGTKTYNTIQPRFAAFWNVNEKLLVHTSVSRMAQFLHILNTSNIGLTADLWVPSTEQIAPEKAWQYDVGLIWNIKKSWYLDASAYYKNMTGLIAYREGANILTDWENNVTTGTGKTKGIELSLKKTAGKTTGWLAYSWSYADRVFEDINFGRVYPYRFDRRHNAHLVVVHRFNAKWELTGNWSYGTGLAFSAPVNKYVSIIPGSSTPPEVIDNQPAKNNARMPAYHRLDVSANYTLRKKRTETKFTFGAYNAYNERHPLYFAYQRQPTEENLFHQEFVVFELLPIMPVLSISMKW